MREKGNDKKKKFLRIGDTRIKVGNIKDYGIEYETILYEKVYKKTKKTYSKTMDAVLRLAGFGKPIQNPESDYDLTWDGGKVRIDEIRYLELSSELRKTYKMVLDDNGVAKEMIGFTATIKDVIEKECKYLYLTTYQNDTYEFYEMDVDFDLEEKCKEIDEIFS